MDTQMIEIDRYIDRYKIPRKLKISWFLLGREAEWFGDRERDLLFLVYSLIAFTFVLSACVIYLNFFFFRKICKKESQ